jgi:hypothetical protein
MLGLLRCDQPNEQKRPTSTPSERRKSQTGSSEGAGELVSGYQATVQCRDMDDLRLRCDEQRRRDPKRRADHATDQDPEIAPPCFRRQREHLGQADRLVELDI